MPPGPVFQQGYEDGLAKRRRHPYGYPTVYSEGYTKGQFERAPWRKKLYDLGAKLQVFAQDFRTQGPRY